MKSLFSIILVLSYTGIDAVSDTLVLVHAIIRHGDRTPEANNLYRNGPYYDERYYAPYGYGQLTNKGKLTSYNVGKALRERYNGFLNETYNIKLIEARSSDFNRTKNSLQVILAGLFPPTKELVWLEGLDWQPIAYNYVERQYDKELFGFGCPNWDKYFDQYLATSAGKVILDKYKGTFEYISGQIGENITDLLLVYYLYFGFEIQNELNMTLPEWTKLVFPDPMKNLVEDYYDILLATSDMKQMAAGYFLKKIVTDTQKKIDGSLPAEKKMFIYSGHENNIASLLRLLNLKKNDEVPPYGSYILIELHNVEGQYGLMFYYQNYATSEPVLMKIPNCEEFCPLDRFLPLVHEYVSKDDSACGTVGTATRNLDNHVLLLFSILSAILANKFRIFW